MRKIILSLFFLLLFLLVLSMRAQAQAETTLDTMTVQLWPDHDQPSVLVIYDFTLDANTPLPAVVHFQIPSIATLSAVAKSADIGLLTVEPAVTTQGENSIVTFTITDKTDYHLEYYMPYTLDGATRDFVYTWPGDYAVKSFKLIVQKPVAATGLTTDPILTAAPTDKDGFSYLSTQTVGLAAQKTFAMHVRYVNETDTLSASTLTVKPSSSLTENVSGQVALSTYLPWILAVLAVILIAGGFGWYWYSSRGMKDGIGRATRTRRKTEQPDRQIYCHQCGKRAQPADHFCRTCGAELRQSE